MKKIIFILVVLWLGLSSFANSVKAETKTEAIIGHVITQAIQGNDMDHTEVLTNELNALMHQFSIDIMETLLQNMPNILDYATEVNIDHDWAYLTSPTVLDVKYKNRFTIQAKEKLSKSTYQKVK